MASKWSNNSTIPTCRLYEKMKLRYGYGLNDADYLVTPVVNNKQVMCPYYRKWNDMLQRCYSDKYHVRQPTYKDCTVCDEWLSFMTFRSWMMDQNWQGMSLDKDILFPDNKIYSPETCRFMTRKINSFLLDSKATRGQYLIGTYLTKSGKFHSQINYNGKSIHLGYYLTELEAHNAWKEHKIMQFNELIDDPENEYIREGLIKHRDLLK